MNSDEKIELIATAFDENRERLLKIAQVKIPDALRKRVSPEDLLQDTYIATLKRIDHFFASEHIPIFIRIRTILLQTLTDLARQHLACQKRDAMREIDYDQELDNNNSNVINKWNFLASTMTSPRSRVARLERNFLLKEMINNLNPSDREIIEMRNFENLSNLEIAEILNIEPKAASIRYVRALKRLKDILIELTEFKI